ncbi:toxin-antitoxin system YwqK family antitoxin [Jonesia quinghaiensis]|uniref:toxin-antitoxin system YwqK family antitoxin n=1 Tax=Jonesia quinghaiensis TaxID=262806 RepID=UPI00040F1E0F|nr:hypothetical protein [Jonesia quinghaiensis]
MERPAFEWDPTTLREVAQDIEAATEYANALLAQYRELSNDPEQRSLMVADLVQWLRISGQHTRAEEVARSSLRRRGGEKIIDALESGESIGVIHPDLIRRALRYATTLYWNADDNEERLGQAADLFDACVTSAHITCLRDPSTIAWETYAFTLQHRAKFRLATTELIAALRDANLGLRVRELHQLPTEQQESSRFAVASIVQHLENIIANQELSAGASVTTETFAAGDRSGVGAVQNGLRTGPWLFWFKGGALKAAGSYVDDQLDGPWIWFRDKGLLLQEGSFVESKQQGPWIRYFANGNILDQGTFNAGEKTGLWLTFNEDGTLRNKKRHTPASATSRRKILPSLRSS